MNAYLLSALVIFCFMVFMFVVAILLKDNSVADIGWGLGIVAVTWLVFALFAHNRIHQKLLVFLITVWGVRLAAYISLRHWGKPEDFRYANWRKEWGSNVYWRSFWQVFMLQGAVMFVNILPTLVVFSATGTNPQLKFLYKIACVIWTLGFFFEAVGDYQMYCFKSNPHPHPDHVMKKGLWKYTRHPNYFGEALMWWAVFLIAIPSGMWYVSILSPLLLTWLLLKVSGVTMLEKKYDGDDEYSRYKRATNAFIPWFPKNQT